MNNLILGGRGLLGKSLIKILKSKNQDVICFGGRENGEDARFTNLPLNNIDRVFFTAWDVGGSKYLYSKDTQLFQLKHNTALLQNVMGQLEKTKIPFIFVSTQLAENCDLAYGVTKKIGEVWATSLNAPVARLQNIYGEITQINNTRKNHFISDAVTNAILSKKVTIFTNGEEVRDFMFIDDVANGLCSILEQNLTGVFDVTSGIQTKIIDIAKIIGNLTDSEVIIGKESGKNFDFKPSQKVPGFTPNISIEEGLSRVVNSAKTLLNL